MYYWQETGAAILDSNLVGHGQIKHILYDLAAPFLGMQLKGSMGGTRSDVHGNTDNYSGGGELETICMPSSGGVDKQEVVSMSAPWNTV